MSGGACPGLPIEIPWGTDWNYQLDYKEYVDNEALPVDLTGYTAKMQIRATPDDQNVVATLSTENSCIVIDGPNGIIELLLPRATTDDFTPGFSGVYDLMLIDPTGLIEKFIYGSVTVPPSVTKF